MISVKSNFKTIQKEYEKRGVKVIYTRSRNYILQPNKKLKVCLKTDKGVETTPFLRVYDKSNLVNNIDTLVEEVIKKFPEEWYDE